MEIETFLLERNQSLCEPGDEPVLVMPNFLRIQGLARNFGVTVRHVSLMAEQGWRIDIDALAAAMTPKTRLIALCNPNNPTGAVLDADEMRRILEIARANDVWLLADEAYRGAEIGDRPETPTFWGDHEKLIVTASTSKAISHAGLRIGWIVASPAMIAAAMRRQDYTTIGTGPINQYIAACILQPARRRQLLRRSRGILGRNLAIVDAWIGRSGGRLTYRRPAAGGMALVRYDHEIGSTALSALLRGTERVFVAAGDWLGLDGCLRIGLGGESSALEEGLRRIDRALAKL
jgi:aspartate/methionine/tyrosine aminotransferase